MYISFGFFPQFLFFRYFVVCIRLLWIFSFCCFLLFYSTIIRKISQFHWCAFVGFFFSLYFAFVSSSLDECTVIESIKHDFVDDVIILYILVAKTDAIKFGCCCSTCWMSIWIEVLLFVDCWNNKIKSLHKTLHWIACAGRVMFLSWSLCSDNISTPTKIGR